VDSGKEVKGYADLLGAHAQVTQVKDKKFAFIVNYPTNKERRAFLLHADSQEDADDWIHKINYLIPERKTAVGAAPVRAAEKTHKNSAPEEDIRGILDYWFHQIEDENTEIGEKEVQFWFMRNNIVDDLIRNNFSGLWEKAVKGELDHWTKTSHGLVALIILLDQFTRNMFRDTPKMLEGDKKALDIVQKALNDGSYGKLTNYQRQWLAVPFTRHEDVKTAKQAVNLFEDLLSEAKSAVKSIDFFTRGLDFAKSQVILLEKFGRFPVRNAVLGRENTAAEDEYLNGDKKFFST